SRAAKLLGWQPRYRDIRALIETAWRWHAQHPNGYEKT
ncbi:MAG: UDP-glucose 4-epimerase GalE, partial [Gemmataceae bacterium]